MEQFSVRKERIMTISIEDAQERDVLSAKDKFMLIMSLGYFLLVVTVFLVCLGFGIGSKEIHAVMLIVLFIVSLLTGLTAVVAQLLLTEGSAFTGRVIECTDVGGDGTLSVLVECYEDNGTTADPYAGIFGLRLPELREEFIRAAPHLEQTPISSSRVSITPSYSHPERRGTLRQVVIFSDGHWQNIDLFEGDIVHCLCRGRYRKFEVLRRA